MAESVYKIIELVGTSTESWEKAAAAAVERASKSLRELRVAEVVELDMVIDDGKVTAYIPWNETNTLEGVAADDAGSVYGGFTNTLNFRRFVKK